MNLYVDLEVLTPLVSVSPMMTNVSSGLDLAMRHFSRGYCKDENGKRIEGDPLTCKHLHNDYIQIQWPFGNKFLFLMKDERYPSNPWFKYQAPKIDLRLTLTDTGTNKVM
jgi:hypothetical protein